MLKIIKVQYPKEKKLLTPNLQQIYKPGQGSKSTSRPRQHGGRSHTSAQRFKREHAASILMMSMTVALHLELHTRAVLQLQDSP